MELNPRKAKKQRNVSVAIRSNDLEHQRITKPSGGSERRNSASSSSVVDRPLDVVNIASWHDLGDKDAANRQFYQQYVALRKPCIIENFIGVSKKRETLREHPKHHDEEDAFLHVSAPAILKSLLQTDLREQKLGEATIPVETMVQVERRFSTADRFGQVRAPQRQCFMTMSTFLQKICGIQEYKAGDGIQSTATLESNDDDAAYSPEDTSSYYYLSTQENTASPPVDTENIAPPEPFFGSPCDRLRALHVIPSHISLAGNLRLSSCNLWMGRCASAATHSGLHHDYHDNFYLLLLGQKEFILFPPHDAYHVAMSGDIECIHPNGLISYQNAPIQSDGRPADCENNVSIGKIAVTAISSTEKVAESEGSNEESGYVLSIRNSAAVIGKGFDYQSSDEADEENGDVWSDDDEQDVLDEDDNDEMDGVGQDDEIGEGMLPNNFSWIDPVTMNPDKIMETFPSYTSAKPIRVHIRANQCLYLPASWLHCVISQGSSMTTGKASDDRDSTTMTRTDSVSIPSSAHMAINYWYHPPNCLDSFEHPYDDKEYWEKSM
jgi:Cupin-like domain